LVLGRNLERVKKVIKAFEGAGKNIQAGLLAESSKPLIQIFSDIIIQTTPLGMGEKRVSIL
jgi:shikimate 5-dehydrogenase